MAKLTNLLLSIQGSEITLLKTNEKRLVRDCAESRERSKSLEEELQKVTNIVHICRESAVNL